ncbi:protein HGV2-like isoform X2 [Patiria miniata]|uniref:Nuclear autoantigenic sperm protein n=1 Tax=Patiria miniata TaxID=46514 RepID=A0A913Z9L1_PATMI|nr:protein HGV2-like isoform X2 [Patiria miniata]
MIGEVEGLFLAICQLFINYTAIVASTLTWFSNLQHCMYLCSDIDVEAATLLSQGRRNLLVGDPPSAVQSLQEACELLGAKYGELANECGESYYYYGWALLEMARMETGVLGNALQGVPEEEDTDGEAEGDKVEEEEREKIFHEVQEALEDKKDEPKGEESETDKDNASEKDDAKTESEKEEPEAASEGEKAGDKPSPDDEKKKEEGIEDKGNKEKEGAKDGDKAEKKAMEVDDAGKTDSKKDNDEDDKAKKEGKDEGEEPSGDAEGAEPSKDAEGAEEDAAEEDAAEEDEDEEEGGAKAAGEETKDEDVSNFQLSWEMLELARIIFSRQEGEEFKLKVSQVYLKLGELGLETGNYPQSVEDFTQCLTRQKDLLSNDSRLLAETYYNLALAYSFDQKFDKAIENFGQSTVVIDNRIATLSKKTETEKPASEEDVLQDQKEIKELKALIPEIKAKIADAKAEKTTAENAVGQAMRSAAAEFGLGSSSSGGFASSSSGGFASSSASAPAQTIAVRKPTDPKPDDISHLVHRKRKPEEDAEQETAGKKSRQEEGGGDAATANGVNGTNGVEQTTMNGDAKQSPEKPEIKVKQVEQKANGSAETAAMET